MDFLFDIPVAGLFFQLVAWLVDVVVVFAPSILRAAVPFGFAALCGVMCERSGVVNIGIEGTMLVAAFVGWYAGVLIGPILGTEGSLVYHDASTLGGSSGSPILSFDTHKVVGLHYYGEYGKRNHAVALWKLLDDPFFA